MQHEKLEIKYNKNSSKDWDTILAWISNTSTTTPFVLWKVVVHATLYTI